MSFILDALRKAETRNRDRHNLTVPTGPTVLTDNMPEAPVEHRSRRWPALMAVAALALVVAGWWLFQQRPVTSEVASSELRDSATDPIASSRATAPVRSNPAPARRANLPRETGARALDREARRGTAPAQTAPGQDEPRTSTASADGAPVTRVTPGTVRIMRPDGSLVPESTDSATSADARPATDSRVQTETLPEYRTSLASAEVPIPRLHLDMHVYSAQPAKRFVFINLEKYVEGESINAETSVESIEPEGAVINHKGYRFVLRPD